MRSLKLWLPALLGMLASWSNASALPVPKLPPEATDKPSIVVRVRPVGELMKDIAYIAKMVGQDEVLEAVKPAIDPALECIDGQKPIGFYAKIGPNGVDSHGVLLIPVKNQQDTIALMNTLLGQSGAKVIEGKDGLYAVNFPGAPFGVVFRFANGYMCATVKNTPDAEAGLAPAKLYAPEALFKQGDDSLVSVTFNVDAMPNELKRKGLNALEDGLKKFKSNEVARENNPVVRAMLETVVEELATKVQSLVVDTNNVIVRFDFDRTKENMSLNFRLNPRGGTDLAGDIAVVGTGKSLAAGIVAQGSAASLSANIALPASLKKAFEPVIDEVVAQAWKKTPGDKQQLTKDLLEILAPTFKAGLLDAAIDTRGPNAQGHLTAVVALNVKDADRLEPIIRRIHGMLPENEKAGIKLDVDKVGAIALHQFPAKFDAAKEAVFGPNAQIVVAFRRDAVVFAIGPVADATVAVTGSLDAAAKASPVLEGMMSIRKFAQVVDRKDPGAIAAAAKAFPAGVSDAIQATVTGGQGLDVRFSASTRIIQFGMLMEQARRNR